MRNLKLLNLSCAVRHEFLSTWQPSLIDEFNHEQDNYQIETASFNEFTETIRNWTNAEGWSATKHADLATYSCDPHGHYFLKYHDESIASISIFTYPHLDFSYIGFYVVQPPFRGKGLGLALLEKTILYSQQQRGISRIGLDCLDEMTPLYEKVGFRVVTQDKIWRLEKATLEALEIDTININDQSSLLQDLIDFDADIFGQARQDFLINFLAKPETLIVANITNNQVLGFGAINKFEFPNQSRPNTYRISPVFAKDPDIATAILKQLIALKPGAEIFAETTGFNPLASNIMSQLGFTNTATMQRMLLGSKPEQRYEHMFCLNSLALG